MLREHEPTGECFCRFFQFSQTSTHVSTGFYNSIETQRQTEWTVFFFPRHDDKSSARPFQVDIITLCMYSMMHYIPLSMASVHLKHF